MGQILPKFTYEPSNRYNKDNQNYKEVIYPEEDNITLDTNDEIENYYITYSTAIFQIKNLIKYEIEEKTYKTCESQRKNLHYFKINNLLENHSGDEIFIKVLDFSPDIVSLPDNHPKKYINMKKNKRIMKEEMILNQMQSRYLNKVIGHFDNKTAQKIYLIYESIEKRLHEVILNKQLGSFLNKMRLLRNIIDLIINLHTNGVVSYDISSFSLGLSGDNNELRLITLGNSIKLKGEALDLMRENWFDRSKFDFFTAPEIYLNKTSSVRNCWASDVWSLGILTYIMFREDYDDFYSSLDQLFSNNEELLYSSDKIFMSNKFFELFDIEKIENPFINALITSMLKFDSFLNAELTERPNIFEIADNFNKICKLMELDEEYKIVYKKQDVYDFTSVFDKNTFELIQEFSTVILNNK